MTWNRRVIPAKKEDVTHQLLVPAHTAPAVVRPPSESLTSSPAAKGLPPTYLLGNYVSLGKPSVLFYTPKGGGGGSLLVKICAIRTFLSFRRTSEKSLTHHGSDKSFIFRRFSCESLTNITHFCYHPLPRFFWRKQNFMFPLGNIILFTASGIT